MVELLNRLFESREYTHGLHLKTKSYAKHKALQDYYEGIVEHIDQLAEAYQGQYGLIEDYTVLERTVDKDPVEYLQEIASFVKEKRKEIFNEDNEHLLAIVDEIELLIYTTLYKLQYLE